MLLKRTQINNKQYLLKAKALLLFPIIQQNLLQNYNLVSLCIGRRWRIEVEKLQFSCSNYDERSSYPSMRLQRLIEIVEVSNGMVRLSMSWSMGGGAVNSRIMWQLVLEGLISIAVGGFIVLVVWNIVWWQWFVVVDYGVCVWRRGAGEIFLFFLSLSQKKKTVEEKR